MPDDKKLLGREVANFTEVGSFEEFFGQARGLGAVIVAHKDQLKDLQEA